MPNPNCKVCFGTGHFATAIGTFPCTICKLRDQPKPSMGIRSEPPTRAGYYWVRRTADSPAQVARLVWGEGNPNGPSVQLTGSEDDYAVDEFLWGYKIEQPN